MHLVMDAFLFDPPHSSPLTVKLVKFVIPGQAGQRRT